MCTLDQHDETIRVDFEDAHLLELGFWATTFKGYVYRYNPETGKNEYMHRVILGKLGSNVGDHRDGVRRDNRRHNLRVATDAQNKCNRGKTRANTSGYKGVFATKNGKWFVQCKHAGVMYRGGTHACKIEAAKAYDRLAVQYHGEFAVTNFPQVKSP